MPLFIAVKYTIHLVENTKCQRYTLDSASDKSEVLVYFILHPQQRTGMFVTSTLRTLC